MVILKKSYYPPVDFGGEVKKKQRFPKWLPSVPDEHAIYLCGAILTNKRSILTNSGNTILTVKFKMVAVNNEIREQS